MSKQVHYLAHLDYKAITQKESGERKKRRIKNGSGLASARFVENSGNQLVVEVLMCYAESFTLPSHRRSRSLRLKCMSPVSCRCTHV